MKTQLLIILAIVLIGKSNTIGQTYPRNLNPNYMWTVLEDNFTGSGLDRTTWQVTGDIKDNNLFKFVDSSATINVNQTYNQLDLTMIKPTGGYNVVVAGDTLNIPIITGEKQSIEDFSYGIFECSATFAYNKGSFPAFWLYNDSHCSISKRNEIDIVECKKDRISTPTFDVGIWYYPYNCGDAAQPEFEQMSGSWNGVHTYKCEYSPSQIKVYRDNVLKYTLTENNQDWYPDQKMHVRLSQQAVRYGWLDPSISEIVTPQTSKFHWVKVKQFFLAPEITCPNIICSTGNASLDVDERATNIHWELTPTNLFTGTTFAYSKNASINAAQYASGQGKIKYTFNMPSGEIFTAERTFWVGAPDIDNIEVYYSSDITGSYPDEFCAGDVNELLARTNPVSLDMELTSIYWDMGSWDVLSYDDEGYVLFEIPLSFYESQDVYYEVANTCNSAITSFTLYEGDCNGYYLLFTPNPSTSETILSIESDTEINLFDDIVEWDLEIYDAVQTLKEKKTKLKGKEHKIQTAGWKEEVYAVRVKYKDEILTGKLVVKK